MHDRLLGPWIFALGWVLALAPAALGDVTTAGIFADHMVLQRDKRVPVWGWADPGEKVTVAFAGQSKSSRADANGKWRVVLDPLKVNARPQTLTIAGKATIRLRDILVGDLWICSGQSNMGRSVDRSVIPDGMKWQHPTIRYWGAGKDQKYPIERFEEPKPWTICQDEESTRGCCAVGFFFARRIQQDVDVPIGLLWQAWAGSIIREWMPRHAWRTQPELEELADQVADVFGPEMILQRDAPVPVWGTAEPGETLTVTFAEQTKAATADEHGRWSVVLDAMAASADPRSLIVTQTSDPVVFENIRVGEVWLLLCRRLGAQYTAEGPVPHENTRFREFGAARDNSSPTPLQRFGNNRPWGPGPHQRADVLSIPFANRLSETLGVPVGIVRVEIGDLDATIPFQGFAAIPALAEIAARVESWHPTAPRGKAAYGQWYERMKRWKQTMDQAIERGDPIEPSQPPLAPGPEMGDPTQPTVVFNRQLNPLVPFALRGALHAHDDSNVDDPLNTLDRRYRDKMRALIAGLRVVFRRPDLAFAFSQRSRPNIYHQHTLGGMLDFNAWHGHRDRQRRMLPYDKTGMIVTLDIENHPGEVGRRFARWALADIYDRGGASSGPLYKGLRIEGDRVVIEFDHTDGGLMVAEFPEVGGPLVERKDRPLRFFAIAGADRIFHRAEAVIRGNTVVVHSDAVSQPEAVRYACQFDPHGMNLYNRAGLPASPFRTDAHPIDDFEETVERLAAKSPDALAAMLGHPAMLHSHAAAKALGVKGEASAMPIVARLMESKDPDRRCGALRTLGYLYWMGPVPRAYYSTPPQDMTSAIDRAVATIAKAADDANPSVRRSAAEALSLIGSEDERIAAIIHNLATDNDARVRTAALRLCKYRFKQFTHTTVPAYALLSENPFGDRISAGLAGNLLNHYRLSGPTDLEAVGRYLLRIEPGRGGPVVGNLGDLLLRVKKADGTTSLDDPQVLPGVLHLYALGCRNYMLYGVERWIGRPENVPTFRREIVRLKFDVVRLHRDKPKGWADRSRRYEDAIKGLEAMIERVNNTK